MLRRKLEVLGLAVLVAALSLTEPAFAKKQFFAIATGGTGGTYYPLGGVLAQAMSKKVADIIVTAQSGNASVANCNLIGKHEIEHGTHLAFLRFYFNYLKFCDIYFNCI